MRKNSSGVVSSPIGGSKSHGQCHARAAAREQQTNHQQQGPVPQKRPSSSVSVGNNAVIHGQNTSFQYEYNVLEKLGSGMYGEIFKVSRKRDNKVFVLKKVPLDGLTAQQINLSMSEHLVMRKLDHPNIVKFHESCVDGRAIQIIMEHAPRGDLSGMIELQTRNKTLFDEKVLWEYLIQICEGLAYLHANRILHRDIKAQNIFLDANLNIKIGDLGLVREFGPASVNAFSQVGTPLYFSPELCKEEPYNEKSDVWSFGCLMYEMACLRKPFEAKTTMALMQKICFTEPPKIPDVYSKELQFVITKMLEKDANFRPTVGQILGYGPVLKLLPDSKFRRKVEALNKYRDEMHEELQEGKRAISRLYTMGRERKAEREENKKKFAALNRTIESLKDHNSRLESKLEEKTVELDQYKGKLCSARKEKKSLLNRVKHLEEHNKLLDSKVKKNKTLYLEAKRMLEDERSRSRQRSRPPTPQRRNIPTPNRKGRHSDSVSDNGYDRTTPVSSPNPSPIPFANRSGESAEPVFFTSKQLSPLSSRVIATTPSPRPALPIGGLSSPIAKGMGGENSKGKGTSNSRCSHEAVEAELEKDYAQGIARTKKQAFRQKVSGASVEDTFPELTEGKLRSDEETNRPRCEVNRNKGEGFQSIAENLDTGNDAAVVAHTETTCPKPMPAATVGATAAKEPESLKPPSTGASNETSVGVDAQGSHQGFCEGQREYYRSKTFPASERDENVHSNAMESISPKTSTVERLQKFPHSDSAFAYSSMDRCMATPSPQIDLPPSIARIRFDSFSESKNISHESSGRGFEDRSKDNSAAVQTSLKTSAKSLSFVSPPPRFVKRTRFLDSGRSMDSPEFTTDSPLQPKNFADLLYEQDVVIRESTPPIKKAFATEEALLSKTTPAPRRMATEGKAIRPPTQYSFSKGASWGSNSVGRQVPLSPSFVPSSKSPKRPVASPGKYSPSRFAGGLTFDPQFFGLNLSVDDAMMGHRFTGLYRWQRVQNEKNKPGRRKGSVAKSRVWRNHCPFQLQATAKNLCILYKARGNKNPRLKTFKVRWERAGVNSFETVKVFDPIQISGNSEYERWFLFDVNQDTKSDSNNVSEVLLHFEEENINAVEEVVVLEFDRKFIELAANTRNSGKRTKKVALKTPENGQFLEQYEQETVYQPAHTRRRQQQSRHRSKDKVTTGRAPTAKDLDCLSRKSIQHGALTPTELAKLADMCRNYESNKKGTAGAFE